MVKNTSIYLVANILSALLPFLALPYITDQIGPAGYADIGLYFSLVAGLNMFIGVNGAGLIFKKYSVYRLKHNYVSRYVSATVLVALLTFLVISLIVYISNSFNISFFGLSFVWLQLAVITSLCNYILSLQLSQLQIDNKAILYGLLQLSIPSLSILLAVLLISEGFGSAGRIYAHSLVLIPVTLILLVGLKRKFKLTVEHNVRIYKSLGSFGLPLIFHLFGIYAITQIDKLFLLDVVGKDQLGVYIFAIQFGLLISYIFDSIHKAILPRLYESLKTKKGLAEINRFAGYYALFSLFLIVIYFYMSKLAITLLFDETFLGAIQILPIILVGQAFQGIYLYYASIIFYFEDTLQFSTVSFCLGFLNIVGLYLLVPHFQVIGAALSFSIVMFLRSIYVLFFANAKLSS